MPCSACFTVLKKTKRFLEEKPDLRSKVEEALGASGLTYEGTLAVRHPVEVLVNDQIALGEGRQAVVLARAADTAAVAETDVSHFG